MWLYNLLFSSLLQLWYFEIRISRSVQRVPWTEITRVDCITFLDQPPLYNSEFYGFLRMAVVEMMLLCAVNCKETDQWALMHMLLIWDVKIFPEVLHINCFKQCWVVKKRGCQRVGHISHYSAERYRAIVALLFILKVLLSFLFLHINIYCSTH